MSASPEELIAINSLLIEREAAFARVHTAESQINELLGGEYPFEAPRTELPSSIKKKVAKRKKTKAKAATLKPRRLNEAEVAYRLTWMDRGQAYEENCTGLKQVTALLEDALPEMKLIKIETVDIHENVVETLFEGGC